MSIMPTLTPTDGKDPQVEEFLYQVFYSTKQEEAVSWGFPPEEADSFIRTQWVIRQQAYQLQYPYAKTELIIDNHRWIGSLMTLRTEEALHLIDLALLPTYRNQQHGSSIITKLQQDASERHIPILLHVLAMNPALRLYQRMGFHITGNHEPYLSMQWTMDTGT